MKKVIITEDAERFLIKRILQESDYSAKVELVKKFLDKNFARGAFSKKNDDGTLQDSDIVVQLDSRHQPTKTILSDVQLFYIVQNKFKNISLELILNNRVDIDFIQSATLIPVEKDLRILKSKDAKWT